MAAVRRGAWVLLKYVTSLFFLGVILQFFFVGYGLFGMKSGDTIDNANSLNAHRDFGFILSDVGGILILVLALIAWPTPRRMLVRWIVLGVLALVQPELADYGHKWVGLFHPVNAILLLGLSGFLAHYAWRRKEPEIPPVAAPSG